MIQQVRVNLEKLRKLAAQGKSVEEIMGELNISETEELKKALQGLMHETETDNLPVRKDSSYSIISIDESGKIVPEKDNEKKEKY